MGRARGRSSFLGRRNAKFLAENKHELRNREKPGLTRQPTFPPRERVYRAHRVGSGKSCLCQSASQVILRVAMLAWKIRASQADNRFHLSRRYADGQQFSSQPQIDDAPVYLGKAFPNVPTLQPTLINTRSPFSSHVGFRTAVPGSLGRVPHSCRIQCHRLRGRTQQILGGAGQNRVSLEDFDPRERTGSRPAFELLISKAGQSSQVTPVGAGPVATVSVGQLSADKRGYNRFQRSGADTNPSLEVPRAGLKHHTRLMPISSHPRQHITGGLIQVQKNIAGVVILGEGEKINVKALKVACTQKAHYRSPQQLTNIPHSFAWTRPSCEAMDQANEIELIRHRRQLAMNCMRGNEESAIVHGHEDAQEAPRAYNGFSLNGNNPLNHVSHSKGASQSRPPFLSYAAFNVFGTFTLICFALASARFGMSTLSTPWV